MSFLFFTVQEASGVLSKERGYTILTIYSDLVPIFLLALFCASHPRFQLHFHPKTQVVFKVSYWTNLEDRRYRHLRFPKYPSILIYEARSRNSRSQHIQILVYILEVQFFALRPRIIVVLFLQGRGAIQKISTLMVRQWMLSVHVAIVLTLISCQFD